MNKYGRHFIYKILSQFVKPPSDTILSYKKTEFMFHIYKCKYVKQI
jgi:hypothetical protein